jgi:hypothetical protein
MRSAKAIALFLVLVPGLVSAQKKPKKPAVPAVFNQAQYIYVEAIDGDEFKPGLLTEDRLAIADLRDALHAWGRYTYTPEREHADLVFIVRKGRLASAHAGVEANEGPDEIGTGSNPRMSGPGMGRQQQGQRPPGLGTTAGAETGPEDDLLEIRQMNTNGKLSSPLWMRSMPNGLNPPRMLLFAQFKEEVDRAYPKNPAPQTPKP